MMLSFQNIAQAGIPVFFHFCGGDLETISVFEKETSCCGEEESEDNDCCATEVNILQQHADGLPELKKFDIKLAVSAFVHVETYFNLSPNFQISTSWFNHSSPPLLVQTKVVNTAILRI